MGVPKVPVGGMDRSGLAALRAYVEAVRGTVEITTTFGERKVVVRDGHHTAA
ncbi:hypothetical protein GCM10017607_17520 [Microbacterium thalassium]|nr:hypothetical protein GCM10017607_17520 [Microbacterium thalassium]